LSKPDAHTALLFSFFNEIGIIGQLSARLFERHLPDGFLISHFSVLNHLVRLGDGTTPLALARAFQVPKTTMTHTLAGLEKAGLIAFAANPKDGRSKCVMLTPEGRAFREGAIARLGAALPPLLATVDPADIAAAMPVLAAVRAWLDQERDG
jgi:DNA-binding MarR family transcriptional regulator